MQASNTSAGEVSDFLLVGDHPRLIEHDLCRRRTLSTTAMAYTVLVYVCITFSIIVAAPKWPDLPIFWFRLVFVPISINQSYAIQYNTI